MWHSPFQASAYNSLIKVLQSISENWNSREIFFLFVSFFSSIICLFLEIKSPKYRIILDICSLNNQEICDELLIMHMHGCIFILFYFFCHLSVKWLHVDFPKVLRRISYGAVRRTFHTWLAPILPTQKRVGALGPIRVAPKDPWG